MSRREFQLIEGTASKFWSITLEGLAHTVNYGRIGTSGQSTRKEFATESEAKTSHDKLIAEKVKKGIAREVGGQAPKVRRISKLGEYVKSGDGDSSSLNLPDVLIEVPGHRRPDSILRCLAMTAGPHRPKP